MVTVTEWQGQWIKAQVARAKFTNDREYIRDLIRCDQGSAKFQTLKAVIQEGLETCQSR
jgi:Arc/MetJ-type ribon-helix-helix transcriptional regulator